jgi:hypothetical protein
LKDLPDNLLENLPEKPPENLPKDLTENPPENNPLETLLRPCCKACRNNPAATRPPD